MDGIAKAATPRDIRVIKKLRIESFKNARLGILG